MPNAEYHAILGLDSSRVLTWNLEPALNPSAIVDLDQVRSFPEFPKNCNTVLAFNLLEHLYDPLRVMEWVCKNLPPNGIFIILNPFLYPIHPSPNDYWRMTPQMFERFFSEINKDYEGTWQVKPLGEDLRELTAIATAPLFKSGLTKRVLANLAETTALLASASAKFFGGSVTKNKLTAWAKNNPPAIGVLWKKQN
ncbi:MAG: hypothetical protein AB7F43_13120 [Bacteriovoracia bacterium]